MRARAFSCVVVLAVTFWLAALVGVVWYLAADEDGAFIGLIAFCAGVVCNAALFLFCELGGDVDDGFVTPLAPFDNDVSRSLAGLLPPGHTRPSSPGPPEH